MTSDTTGGHDGDFLFQDEEAPGDLASAPHSPPWVVLVVDDDADVVMVTRLALADMRYQDRGLDIISCTSGREARAALAARSDIAVVLLDVVMETDDAGLQVVRHIRETLDDRKIRIILRTGQPGQAPEQDVILGYDINDYKSKTELTAQKLFTAMVTALRSYGDLVALEAHRDGLRQVADASAGLFRLRTPDAFIGRTLEALIDFAGGERGAIFCRELAGSGVSRALRPLAMQGWAVETEASVLAEVEAVAEARRSKIADDHCLQYLATADGRELIIYLAYARRPEAMRHDLLELFVAKVGIGYDNVVMHEWQTQTNRWLEEQVQERTRELSEKTLRLERAHRQLADELQLAHILQQAILPTAFPAGEAFGVTATMIPASMVGGDFYHIVCLDDHRFAFLIADVSGKGVPAAFFMLRAHGLLHQITLAGLSPAACLDRANRELCEANPLSLFITLFFGVLDTRTGRLDYATAGHDMPLLARPDGTVAPLPRAGGALLGLIEDATYTEASVTLAPGDRLFLFTDGFTEAMNETGGWFGEDRLAQSLARHAGLPLAGTMQAIIADVHEFAAGQQQSDDITCVLVRLGSV